MNADLTFWGPANGGSECRFKVSGASDCGEWVQIQGFLGGQPMDGVNADLRFWVPANGGSECRFKVLVANEWGE